MGEKVFAELQPQWNEAFGAARAPFEAAQKASVERRQAMIAEAAELGAAPMLRIDAVKALQQRWQAEAQTVPLDRRHEQKLWDAFRAPIDEAFNRKSAEREKAAAAMSEHDRDVLDASKALEAANATGDAQKIRAAMAQLEAALRGEAPPPAPAASRARRSGRRSRGGRDRSGGAGPGGGRVRRERRAGARAGRCRAPPPAAGRSCGADADLVAPADGADPSARTDAAARPKPAAGARAPPKPAPKPVIAVRGDDRPGNKKAEPRRPAAAASSAIAATAAAARGGRPAIARRAPATAATAAAAASATARRA